MSGVLLFALGALTALLLACFSVRRLVLLAASLRAPRPVADPSSPVPSVTLLVPARDESLRIKGLLAALDALDYPAASLSVVLIDDDSGDDTAEQMERWAQWRAGARVLGLDRHAGKSGALNAALAAAPASDLIAVCDADLRPQPDWLRRLVGCFADDGVGAAAAYLRAENPDAGPVARYAALETWTHQLVTSAGKDRLGLDPPLHGASVYRRSALDAIGGFRPGGPGEDVHSSVALARLGWRTRFIVASVVRNTLVSGWRAYWHQHIRWGRNVFAAGSDAAGPSGPPPRRVRAGLARRLEGLASRAGYADRLVFVAAIALAAVGELSVWFPAAYAAIAVAEAAVAAVKAGAAHRLPLHLASALVLVPCDVAASFAAAIAHIARRPRTWQASRRGARAPEGA